MIDKINTFVPDYSDIYSSALEVYSYSMGKASSLKEYSVEKTKSTQQCVLAYRKQVEGFFNKVLQKATHEILFNVEKAIGIQEAKSEVVELQTYQKRIETIINRILKGYIYHYQSILKEKGLQLSQKGKERMLPFYVSLKATLLISKEILMEFLQSKFNNMKLHYESSKDVFVMLISGKFNEEDIKNVIFDQVDEFKKLTVEVVQKGLEIKVDRASLVKNFDLFSSKFLETIKKLREKGEDNLVQVKEKSKNMYKEVIQRIKAKEMEILVEMKAIKSQ